MRIHRRGPWRTFDTVELATLELAALFDNRRLLQPIGNIPPVEAEANFNTALETETATAKLIEICLGRIRRGSGAGHILLRVSG